MSQVLQLSDDDYQKLVTAATVRGQTPEELVRDWVRELSRDPHTEPRYYETDDWLRHLGVSEDVILGSGMLRPALPASSAVQNIDPPYA